MSAKTRTNRKKIREEAQIEERGGKKGKVKK